MHLNCLEIQGFKSFADRVEIEFGPGVTVIVGPNGCGKSNLIEAVQWVLGEQNARTLRGYKMEDVIFSGTARRRSLGMAEVSITLDNKSGSLPVAYEEVRITRRVYRSGEGEYFINKIPCRLRDIQELFSACGIGRAAFYLIPQGKIEEFLSLYPEERRLYLEEVAGISKYQRRKAEAVRKLEETEGDLVRLRDILEELERQRVPLVEQAKVAELHHHLQKNLRNLELRLLKAEFLKISRRQELFAKAYQEIENSLAQKHQKVAPLEEEVIHLKIGLEEGEEKISQIEKEYEQIQKSVQELSVLKVRNEEKLTSALLRKAELDSQILAATQKTAEINKELEEVEKEFNRCSRQKSELEQSHNQLEKEKSECEELKVRTDRDWELVHEELLKIFHQKTALAGQIREVKNKKEILLQQHENLKKKGEEGNRRILELQEQIREQTKICELHAASLQNVLEALTRNRRELQSLQKEKENLGSEIQKNLQKIQDEKIRLSFLKEAEENKDGYERGVKVILRALAEGHPSCQDVLGLVEEFFSIEPEYALALDAALGRAAHYFVCTTPEAAQSAITYLKTHGAGRASFLPLTALAHWEEKERSFSQCRGTSIMIGRAADLVRCDQKYRAVVEFLLGRTFVAKSMRSARDFAERNHYRVRVVTLEGELIQPGGLITGGKFSPRFSASYRRKQEIARFSAQLSKYHQTLEELKKREESSNLEINRLEEKIKELENLRLSQESEKNRDEQKLFSLSQELKQLSEFTQNFFAVNEVRPQLEDLDKSVVGLEKELSGILEKERNLEARRGEIEKTRTSYEERLQVRNGEITALKIDLSSLNQEFKHLSQRKRQVQDLLARQEGEVKKIIGEHEKLNREIQELQNQEKEIQEKLDNLENKKRVLQGELSFRKKQFRARKAYCSAKERRCQKIKQKVGQHQQQLRNMEIQLAHLKEQEEQLLIRAHEYGVTLTKDKTNGMIDDQVKKQIKEQIMNLKQELDSLGEVNFTAPGELRSLEERLNFLLQQKRDLEEGKGALNRVIREMDQIVVNRFQKTYREVKENFKEVFATLCEGGQAELILTDEKNPLESGLEVMVLPRGKKPRHLSLLSGGEKALTGITFLFALLKTRPSPFYCLDEIEAFLDEVNIARFTNFLKKMAESSQLILISHRYQTMQVADTLYGVTMEEPGISKLVSVQLTDSKWVRAG
ncbi:MAG: chromosome segregation protein SMC [Bacillota bacterium]|nr:chromosome segregation protein SMC [Bacillota bacterium]